MFGPQSHPDAAHTGQQRPAARRRRKLQVSPALGLSVAFSHFFIESARIDLQGDAPGNATRGNLADRSDNAVDLLAMQFVWRF